jgi:hypothetical protein
MGLKAHAASARRLRGGIEVWLGVRFDVGFDGQFFRSCPNAGYL